MNIEAPLAAPQPPSDTGPAQPGPWRVAHLGGSADRIEIWHADHPGSILLQAQHHCYLAAMHRDEYGNAAPKEAGVPVTQALNAGNWVLNFDNSPVHQRYLYVRHTEHPGVFHLKADDEGYVLDTFAQADADESFISIYALYNELSCEEPDEDDDSPVSCGMVRYTELEEPARDEELQENPR